MSTDLDLSKLSHAEKDALILTLLARLDEAHQLIAQLQARIDELTRPDKTPDNSSLPPSKGLKPNRPEKAKRQGPRRGSLGRKGGGRSPPSPMKWWWPSRRAVGTVRPAWVRQITCSRRATTRSICPAYARW